MTDELPPCRCTCTCDLYGQTLIECLQELEADREPAVTGPGEDPLRDATNEGYELGLDMLRSVLVAHGIEVCPAADETDQPKED